MTVNVLIITHGNIGKALLNATITTLGKIPLPSKAIEVKGNTDPEIMIPELKQLCQNIDQGSGVLILTDMYGSTPSNIANALRNHDIRVVTGVNLPMLIRVMNYPQLDLEALAEKAYTGGRDGILNCEKTVTDRT